MRVRWPVLFAVAAALLLMGWLGSRWLIDSRTAQTQFPPNFFPAGLPEDLALRIAEARSQVEHEPAGRNWGAMARLLMSHELFSQADYCFEQAIVQEPESQQWWYLRGVLNEEHDLELSKACYQRAAELRPGSWFVDYRLGKLYLRTGELDESRSHLEACRTESQAHPEVLMSLARLYEVQGDAELAIETLMIAANDSRAGQDLSQELTRLLRRQARLDEAARWQETFQGRPAHTKAMADPWLKSVVAISPHLAEDSQQAARLAVEKNLLAAMKLYEKLSDAEQRNSRPPIFHAMLLAEQGHTDSAVAEIDEVCKKFPSDPLAFSCQAAILQAAGMQDGAIASLRKAIEIKPDFVEAHQALADALDRQGDSVGAEKEFEIIRQLQPGISE